MRKFSKIKRFIHYFTAKTLITLTTVFFTLLIAYFFFIKYKDLILEQIILNKNKILYTSNNIPRPSIIIIGNKYINKKSLVRELHKKLNLIKNKSDLSIISHFLKKKSLIKKFIITKTSENLMTIKIEEKNIIGIAKYKNKNYLIDDFNNLIEAKITPNLFNLPIFNGKNSNKNANVILRLIRENDINLKFTSFSLIDDRRWNINLNNGVKILLPENKVLNTLKLLKKINSEYDILKGNFIEIDLRIHGKYFLKPKIN